MSDAPAGWKCPNCGAGNAPWAWRCSCNANAPHEYVGAEVDIGVGSVFEPCHICGRENYESIHEG